MLKQMRESFKHLKWVLIFVIVVFVFMVFAEWGASGLGEREQRGAPFAARVNGEAIPIRDFQRALYLTEQRYSQMYGQPITAELRQMLGLSRQVLNSLVDEKLMLQEAKRLNLAASPEEVRRQIFEIPVLNPGGQFIGTELYERYVTTTLGYSSAAEFEADLARQLTVAKLESAMRNAVVFPAGFVEAEYRRREDRAQIRYALLSAVDAAEAISVTPDEVERYFREHGTRYSNPEQRRISYLRADPAAIRAQISLTEADLRSWYEQNLEAYRTEEMVRAQHILISLEEGASAEERSEAQARAAGLVSLLRAGGDFDALARQHSADPGSAANGGDLGLFGRGRMVSEFETAAFSLPIGQISDPVQTQFGFHIIRVNERRPGGYRPFEEVRAELEQQTIEERSRTQARDRLAQVRARLEQVRAPGDAEMQAQTDAIVTYNSSPFFGRNDEIAGLGRLPAVNAWAWSASPGQLGPIVDTQVGPVLPLLTATRPAGIPPLDEIRNRVEYDLKLQRAREQAAQRITAAMAEAGGNFDAAASALGVAPIVASITRTGPVSGLSGDSAALVEAALAAGAAEVRGPIMVDAGAVVMQVVEPVRFDREAFERDRPSIVESMRQTEVFKLRQALLTKLRSEARIVLNPELAGQQGGITPLG